MQQVTLVLQELQELLNLYVDKTLVLFLLLILGFIIFSVSVKKIVYVSILMFVLAFPLALLNRQEAAEMFGNFAYGILFLGVLKMIFENSHESK